MVPVEDSTVEIESVAIQAQAQVNTGTHTNHKNLCHLFC